MVKGLNAFVGEYPNLFALLLGVLIFYNFTSATNVALRFLLGFFSSIMVISLMTYLGLRSFEHNTSFGTKFALGIPLCMMDIVFTIQIIQSFFERQNSALVSSLLNLEFLLAFLSSLFFIGSIIILILLLRMKSI